MKFTLLLASLGLVAVAGCLLPAEPTVAFSSADFQNFKGAGTAEIKGRAFLTTYNDNVILASGDEVDLTPATPYTKQRFSMAQSGRTIAPPDPGLARYVRTTVADDEGNFVFRNVPPGEYIVACTISWEVPSEYLLHAYKTKSETVQMTATVPDGEIARVVLTE
jgi:hypothetical protein